MIPTIGNNIDQAASSSLTMTSCSSPLTAIVCQPNLQLDL